MRWFCRLSRLPVLLLFVCLPWQNVLSLQFSKNSSPRLPFLANEGQVQDPSVCFVARTFGGMVAVHNSGVVTYNLPKFEGSSGLDNTVAKPVGTHVIRELLLDSLQPRPQGAERQTTTASFFVGSSPSGWRSSVAAYNTVDMGEVYDGITLALRADRNNVEKIFTVAPGANPALIRMRVEGIETIRILPDGRLELVTSLGPVSFSAPVAFQERCGRREDVRISYALQPDGYGFELGAYDAALPLVIDPLLASTFIGGSGDEVGMALAADQNGNVYVAGYTASLDFPVTNSCGMSRGSMLDAFVSKLNLSLTNLIASAYLGGSQDDAALAIAYKNDSVFVAGYSASQDYPVTPGAFERFNKGGRDGVVSVLNPDLTLLRYSTYLGGSGNDKITGICVDPSGFVYVSGKTASSDFPLRGSPIFQQLLRGPTDAFAGRFNPTLNILMSSTYLGGTSNDEATAMALDADKVVLVGRTWSTNFPVATNAYQKNLRGNTDAFITRMPLNLATVQNSTYLGGTNNEGATALAVDTGTRFGGYNSGIITSIFVTGFTDSRNFPTNQTVWGGQSFGNSLVGTQDAFVVRMHQACSNIYAGSYLGGSGTDIGRAILLDPVGAYTNEVIVVGQTGSPDFPVIRNAYRKTPYGLFDGFLIRLRHTLSNTYYASSYLGGSGNDDLQAAVLYGNTIFVAGSTDSADYPVNDSAFDITYRGSNDVVVSRMAASLEAGTLRWRYVLPEGRCFPPAQDMQGNIYVIVVNESQPGYLYKFTPEGIREWSVLIDQGYAFDNKACNMSPVIDISGNIYLCGGASGRIFGFRPNGVRFLNYYDNYENPGWLKSNPSLTMQTNLIYGHYLAPRLYSIAPNPPDGLLNWRTSHLGTGCRGTPSIGADGRIHVSTDTSFRTYAADGTPLTTNRYLGVGFSAPAAINSQGNVYVGGDKGNLYGFDTDGTEMNPFQTAQTAGIGGSPVITSNGNIVVLTPTNVIVVGSDLTGAAIWSSQKLTNNDISMSPTLGSEGMILAPSSNHLYCFIPEGSGYITNWRFTAPVYGFLSTPSIALDGTIYVGGMSNIYALFGTESLARTDWPMERHDVLHTGNQAFKLMPFAPGNVQASKGDPVDRVRVTWDFSLNASRYELYRATNDDISLATNMLTIIRGNVYYDSDIVPGKPYYYRVIAKNAYGESPMSEAAYGGIPPLPPDTVLATKGVPLDRVNVSWAKADYANVYQLWRSTNSEPANATNMIALSSGTNAVDNNVVLGVKYYYFARSTNEFGVSLFGAFDYGGTPPQTYAPTVGKGLNFDDIPVSWPFSAGAQAFELWRSVYDIPVTATRIASLPGTNFVDTDYMVSNVVPCRTYYYWIKTTNEFGASAFSASDSGYRLLKSPLNFKASDGGVYSSKVHTVWTPVPYGLTYELRRGDTMNFNAAQYLNRVGGFEFDDATVLRGGTYYYWARTWNDYGYSEWVGPDEGGTPPLTPTGLVATEGIYNDRIILNWQGAYGASGNLLYRGTSIDPSFATLVFATPGTTYEERAVIPGQRYYYWARATNLFGRSGLSASAGGYISLSPPSGLVASDGSFTNRVNIIWNEAPGATTYEVWRNSSNNTNTAIRLVYTAERTFDDTLVTPGVLYYYWIRARTASFSSVLSQPDTGYAASGLADLKVSNFVFLPTRMGLYTTPDAVSFRLRNNGPQPLFGENTRISLDFYISDKPVFDEAGAKWFGRTVQDVNIPVGGEIQVALNANHRLRLEIPYLDTGLYYVYMIVRHSYPSSYLDPNMADNIARRPNPTTIHSFAPSVYACVNDYNGDGIADLAAYDHNTGRWYIRTLGGAILAWGEPWGGPGMMPVLGDFDADCKADLAVYDTVSGAWYIRSLDGRIIAWALPWGGPGFTPVWGDYDGDGAVDLAVYGGGAWYIRTASGNLLAWGVPWGGSGFVPVMGDYNGDGRQDMAVYQPSTWSWYVRTLTGSALLWAEPWGGTTGFIPVPGDYDGDGSADLAVYHAATGYWFIKRIDGRLIAWGDFWGGTGMYPVPGDYDGDGRSDMAVFNPAAGTWHIRSLDGNVIAASERWGGGTIRPVGMGE